MTTHLSAATPSRSLRTIHGVFFAVLLVRLVALFQFAGSPHFLPSEGDMRFYNDWALRILHGQGDPRQAFFGLPLYPYALALLYRICGYSPFIPGLLQTAADALTATFLFRISSSVFGAKHGAATGSETRWARLKRYQGQIVGGIAAAGWAWFVPAGAYSLVVMPTSVAVMVFWLVIAWIVKNPRRPGVLASAIWGTFVGIIATGIASVLFVIPIVLAAICLKPARPTGAGKNPWLSQLAAGAMLLLGVAIGTAPCWVHNYFIARDPVFLSAHGGINFWMGNNPAANGYPNFPAGMRAEQASMLQDSTSLAEAATGHPLRRSEVSKYWSGKATSYIAAHPKAWARLLWLKVLNFWNAFEYDDLSVIQKLRESGIIMPGLHFGVAAALAVPGIVLALRAFSTSGWVLAGILAQMISVLPVFVTERYRLAAVPGLLVFAAFGLWRLWQSLSVGRIRTAALYFAALVASTAFVSIPQTDPALWALISYASGRQALDSNDFARAERELQRARAYVPENPETNLALGNLRLAQGKRTQAASFYAESLRFNPKHKGALNNLGLIALEEGRPRDAARNLQRAIESDPHDATTFYLLAKAELALGNIENARIAIGEALKREPDQPEYQRLGGEIEQHRHN